MELTKVGGGGDYGFWGVGASSFMTLMEEILINTGLDLFKAIEETQK